MGQQQSQNKDKLLYQQVKYGNIQMIKALFLEGARLEWADKQGKTPLIAACLQAELYDVAKTLLKLGANVNTYRPGTQAGTPLHHAAKNGLEPTVKLLLSHGANASVTNYDCQTPMDVARAKGYNNVVRTIESHICLFYGWLRELHGPGFLEESTSRSKSNKIWAVVIPSAFCSPTKPRKLLLVIYCTQDAQPRSVILLWKAKIEEPEFHQLDPTFVIFDEHTKTQYKFASTDEGDKQQLQCFYNACTGISQVIRSSLPLDSTPSIVPATAPPTTTEDVDLAMAIKASNDSAMGKKPSQSRPCHSSEVNHTIDANGFIYHEDEYDWRLHLLGAAYPSKGCSSKQLNIPVNDMYNGPSSNATKQWASGTPMMQENPSRLAIPSAPPIPEGADNGQETDYSQLNFFGRIAIPSALPIPKDADSGPETKSNRIDLPGQSLESMRARKGELKEEESDSSTCAICLDAPKEGACLPCGHRAGCMSCLNEIKAKNCGCPLCRAKIQQVVRIYV